MRFSISISVLAAALSACSSAPPPQLRDARTAYQRASQGPSAELVPAQLHTAKTALLVAEKTYDDEGESDNARDRAYVAMRKAELAEVHANILSSQQQIEQSVQRAEVARARQNERMRQNLTATQAELAGQKNLVANQKEELQGERQRRLDAERAAAQAIAALSAIGTVQQETRGTVITLAGGLIFASGQATLLPSAAAKLDQVAAALAKSEGNQQIVIEGHTDSRGTDQLNQDLSNRRAEAVRSYLVGKSVADTRLIARGLGETRPIADNESAEGRATNRRVEIIVPPSS